MQDRLNNMYLQAKKSVQEILSAELPGLESRRARPGQTNHSLSEDTC